MFSPGSFHMGRELDQLALTFVSLVQFYNCEVAIFSKNLRSRVRAHSSVDNVIESIPSPSIHVNALTPPSQPRPRVRGHQRRRMRDGGDDVARGPKRKPATTADGDCSPSAESPAAAAGGKRRPWYVSHHRALHPMRVDPEMQLKNISPILLDRPVITK